VNDEAAVILIVSMEPPEVLQRRILQEYLEKRNSPNCKYPWAKGRPLVKEKVKFFDHGDTFGSGNYYSKTSFSPSQHLLRQGEDLQKQQRKKRKKKKKKTKKKRKKSIDRKSEPELMNNDYGNFNHYKFVENLSLEKQAHDLLPPLGPARSDDQETPRYHNYQYDEGRGGGDEYRHNNKHGSNEYGGSDNYHGPLLPKSNYEKPRKKKKKKKKIRKRKRLVENNNDISRYTTGKNDRPIDTKIANDYNYNDVEYETYFQKTNKQKRYLSSTSSLPVLNKKAAEHLNATHGNWLNDVRRRAKDRLNAYLNPNPSMMSSSTIDTETTGYTSYTAGGTGSDQLYDRRTDYLLPGSISPLVVTQQHKTNRSNKDLIRKGPNFLAFAKQQSLKSNHVLKANRSRLLGSLNQHYMSQKSVPTEPSLIKHFPKHL